MTSTTREPETDYTWTSPSWVARLREPLTTYYLLIGLLTVMVGFGLLMVLSASTVKSYRESGSPYSVFLDQALFAAAGTILAFIASRLPVKAWKWLAVPGMLIAVVLQGLVFTPLGVNVWGNRNWIRLAGFSLQPSEFGKVALIVFGAAVLARKRKSLGSVWHALIPFVIPGAMGLMGLVLLGHDLGTTIVFAAMVMGMLFVAGVRLRWFGVVAAFAVVAGGIFVATNVTRMDRISTWLNGICSDPRSSGACWQPGHAVLAFGDGGWWGVGLGASKEKWSWLAEPHNDFILAVIGEELGLPGTLLVLAMFVVLAWACYRLIVQTTDMFVRLASAGVMTWVLVQAMINIGSVTGLLPVIGVPLPLISSGGSALVATMLAMGMLISFARNHPQVRAARLAAPRWRDRVPALSNPLRRGR